MRRPGELAGLWALRGLTYAIVAAILVVLGDVLWRGLGAIDWAFLTSPPSELNPGASGIGPAIVGTLCLVAGTTAVALPVGMGAAIYLSEYAPRGGRLTELVRLGIVTLAGVPSIVFGLFGLALFVVFLGMGASILAGSLTLACMILPVVIVASEEAVRAVPRSFREASLALGATKWQTVRKVVLPYALPGMLTGSILGVARAAGETAPILFTVATSFSLRLLPDSALDEVMALPYQLYYWATQNPEADAPQKAYGTAVVLIALVLGANLGAILLRNRFRRRYRW